MTELLAEDTRVEDGPIDDAPLTPAELPPFAQVIMALATIDDTAGDDDLMELEEITVGLAIELEIRDARSSQPRVTGSTPTQWTETTILPVFHRLSMRITRDRDG